MTKQLLWEAATARCDSWCVHSRKTFQRAEVCLELLLPDTSTLFRVSLTQILTPKKEAMISGDSGPLSRYLQCQHYNCYSVHRIDGEPRWGSCDHSDFKELDVTGAVHVGVCTLLWKDDGEQARQSLCSRDPAVQREDKMTGNRQSLHNVTWRWTRGFRSIWRKQLIRMGRFRAADEMLTRAG